MILFYTMSASASLQSREAGYLELRTGRHTAFLRIVLEGTESIISKAKVTQQGRNILVKFPGAVFTVHEKKARITYKKDKETIMFSPENFTEYKSFSLKNPDRLVIDVYGTRMPEKNLQTKKNMPVKKTPPKIKTEETTPRVKATEKQDQTLKRETSAKTPDQLNTDNMFTTGQYKKFQDLLKLVPPSIAQKELSGYKLNDTELLAKYHFLYGTIYDAKKDYLPAIKHFTLAAQHADNSELKEQALLKKAGLYLKFGFLYEAKSNYNIFINNFPSSGHIKEAHLGLAKSLNGISSFSKAIEHYKKAAPGAEASFGVANALQRLGRVNEANVAYTKAFFVDNSYPDRSPETYYLIGENKRMTGKASDAKRLLKAIKRGPFRDNANLSLGLIAMEETDIKNAIKYFKSASMSKDRELRMEALINLSTAFSKSGETKEAISILEKIRHKYLHSPLYNKSTFDLARAYREDGRIKESLILLKELAYSKSPPKEVFNELEEILLEASSETEKEIPDDLKFSALWNDFGKWLLDGSREEFLTKMVETLKNERGKPFLHLSTWLIENASKETKARAAADMADFYITMGDPETSKKYMKLARRSKKLDDTIMRIEAKTYHAAGDLESAVEKLMLIKEFGERDLEMFGNMILDLNISELKDSRNVIAFYKKAVNRIGKSNKDYVRLANILYDNGRKDEALKYYEIAHKKGEKDEWAIYRIGILTEPIEDRKKKSEEMFVHLQKGDSIFSLIAKTKLMEIDISNRVAEVF